MVMLNRRWVGGWLMFALMGGSISLADDATNKAAEELLLAMKADKVLNQSIDEMLDVQAKQNPAMGRLRPVMKKFFDKHMSWNAIKTDMIALYAKEFTKEELEEMTRFYKSPVGQKMAEKTPLLTAKGMELGMKRVQENQSELQQMIEAELRK